MKIGNVIIPANKRTAIVDLDPNGIVLEVSESGAGIFGGDIRGTLAVDHYARPNERDKLMSELMDRDAIVNMPVILRDKKATALHVRLFAVIRRDSSGRPVREIAAATLVARGRQLGGTPDGDCRRYDHKP